jgi:hypothetical protein
MSYFFVTTKQHMQKWVLTELMSSATCQYLIEPGVLSGTPYTIQEIFQAEKKKF